MPSMRLVRFVIFIHVIVFGVSFALTAAIARNTQLAFLTGIVSVIASYAGGTTLYKRRLLEMRSLRNSLYNQIQDLEQEEEQIYHSLYEATVNKQEIEGSIQALQYEYERVRLRVSELHNQRSLLYQNLVELKKQQQQQVEPLQKLQKHIQFLEHRQTQVKHSLEIKTTEVQQAETKLTALKLEIEALQNQLSSRDRQQEEIGDRTFLLERQKQELEQSVQKLQAQLQSSSESDPVEREAGTNNENNGNGLTPLLPKEWLDLVKFIDNLSDLEKQTFRAIIEQNEAQLKEIADRHATMPEVLIESLNETAINTLGDTLFIGGSSSMIPEFHEEYVQFLLKPVQLEFKDFLSLQEKQAERQTSDETN